MIEHENPKFQNIYISAIVKKTAYFNYVGIKLNILTVLKCMHDTLQNKVDLKLDLKIHIGKTTK
jgi:hypothetical protein